MTLLEIHVEALSMGDSGQSAIDSTEDRAARAALEHGPANLVDVEPRRSDGAGRDRLGLEPTDRVAVSALRLGHGNLRPGSVPREAEAVGAEGYRVLGSFLSKMLANARARATVEAGSVGAVVYAASRLEVLRAATAIATVVGMKTKVSLGEVGRDDDEGEGLRFFVVVGFSWGALS